MYTVTAVRKLSNIECVEMEASNLDVAIAKLLEYFDDNLVFLVTIEKK